MIKLGVIGSSEGNGHPFSWSAIFNGYDRQEMKTCGYPTIPDYLSRETYPDNFLLNMATVDGVWTQSRLLSEKISKSALIPNVYDNLPDLVRNVDAVLLARDDSENHLKFLPEICKQRKPVYIDKPIAITEKSLDEIIDLFIDNSKFFSCSAFRFHPKIKVLTQKIHRNPQNIRFIGKIPKSWEKYSVHLLDPIIEMLPKNVKLLDFERLEYGHSGVTVNYIFDNQVSANVTTTGLESGNIQLSVELEDNKYTINFDDPFTMFKSALEYFVMNYVQNSSPKDTTRYRNLVKLVSCGSR